MKPRDWPEVEGVIVDRPWGDCPHCKQSYTGIYAGRPMCRRCEPQRMCFAPVSIDQPPR